MKKYCLKPFLMVIYWSVMLQLSGCSFIRPDIDQSNAAAEVIKRDDNSATDAEIKIEFSQYDETRGIPPDWQPLIISKYKKRTEYQLKKQQGRTVLHAKANSSASGAKKKLNLSVQKFPWLSWSWLVIKHLPEADNTERGKEDSPVRIVLAFDGDKSRLSFKDQMVIQQAKLLFGHDMPYATLMYIWENRQPVGTVLDNKLSGRVKMVVAETGVERIGQWVSLRRNVLEDYRKAYGEDPGKLIGLAVMSDSDNTQGVAESFYGDAYFHRFQERDKEN